MGIISDNNKKDIKSRKKHITYEERIIIERYLKDKMSIPKIAERIGKNRKSIYREIKRNWYENKWWYWVYKAKTAQKKTDLRRRKANRKHTKLLKPENWWFVDKIKELIKEYWWSPDIIVWRYKIEKNRNIVCTSTIYRYADNYDKELKRMFLHKEWWYKKRWYKYGKNKKIQELKSIEEREKIIEDRERIWDYEVDLIVSARWDKTVLINMVDRKSRMMFIKRVENKEKENIEKWIRELIEWKKINSITVDNWTEFTNLIDIVKEKNIEWYRCNPYRSYEKWTVEVHNRYIRRYIPKKDSVPKKCVRKKYRK